MTINEFRSKVKPGVRLSVEEKEYFVLEVVKFRFDDGNSYIKCFLSDDFVFADDEESNSFLLVKETKTDFEEPFSKELSFEHKNFTFLYNAHAVAEEIWGEEIFIKGDSERFWDFKAKDGSYLSLGIIDSTHQRLDFYGKVVCAENVKMA